MGNASEKCGDEGINEKRRVDVGSSMGRMGLLFDALNGRHPGGAIYSKNLP